MSLLTYGVLVLFVLWTLQLLQHFHPSMFLLCQACHDHDNTRTSHVNITPSLPTKRCPPDEFCPAVWYRERKSPGLTNNFTMTTKFSTVIVTNKAPPKYYLRPAAPNFDNLINNSRSVVKTHCRPRCQPIASAAISGSTPDSRNPIDGPFDGGGPITNTTFLPSPTNPVI